LQGAKIRVDRHRDRAHLIAGGGGPVAAAADADDVVAVRDQTAGRASAVGVLSAAIDVAGDDRIRRIDKAAAFQPDAAAVAGAVALHVGDVRRDCDVVEIAKGTLIGDPSAVEVRLVAAERTVGEIQVSSAADALAALKSLGVPQRALYREIGPAASALRAMTLLRDPAARIPAEVMPAVSPFPVATVSATHSG
jgi:hypothetical protein